jgi:hypothetical protein
MWSISDDLERVATTVREVGRTAFVISADLTDASRMSALIDTALVTSSL